MPTNKELLMSLGLNDLEADVYILLLQDEGQTGYKIGRMLGKPTANVYKAIDNLARKGAILVEDRQSSHCRAVPLAEFCDLVEAGLKRKTREVMEAFTLPQKDIPDEKSYQLQSVDLVLEKSRRMLESCQTVAMVDAFPKLVKILLPAIEEAIGRGVEVYLQVYEPVEVKGAHVVLIDVHSRVLEYWRSQQLNLVIDGREHLLALLSDGLEDIYQATWSRNLYLSSMLHMGFSNHYVVHRIRQLPAGADYHKAVTAILQQQTILSSGRIPGVAEMLNRFGLQ